MHILKYTTTLSVDFLSTHSRVGRSIGSIHFGLPLPKVYRKIIFDLLPKTNGTVRLKAYHACSRVTKKRILEYGYIKQPTKAPFSCSNHKVFDKISISLSKKLHEFYLIFRVSLLFLSISAISVMSNCKRCVDMEVP